MSTRAERAKLENAIHTFLARRRTANETWQAAEMLGRLAVRPMINRFQGLVTYRPPEDVAILAKTLAEGLAEGVLVGSHQRFCERCGTLYIPKRSDARFCSGKCRVAAFRANRRAPIRMLPDRR